MRGAEQKEGREGVGGIVLGGVLASLQKEEEEEEDKAKQKKGAGIAEK